MKYKTVSSKKARNNFSDLVDMVVKDQNVIITKYGKPTAVLVSYDNFKEKPRTNEKDLKIIDKIREKSEKLSDEEINKLVEEAIKSY